ncbi:MAG TPA: AAA family ATPase, partial [Pirellulales bacterium]
EVGRPVLTLDVGALMGSLLGQSEERTRQALRQLDGMAPCVAMIDEVEKAFAGVGESGRSDGGVSSRMFSTFLTWMNDRESDVFVVCTANDVARLPPEFSRSGRIDAAFFLDLPGRAEKDAIWELYVRRFELDARQPKPADEQWTGAEIRSCCRLAALLDLPLAAAAQNIVPTAVSSAESVERLRAWASGRCLSADRPGVYRRDDKPAASSRRRVDRNPSSN